VQATVYPERATRPYPTRVDAFAEHLRGRWQQGCHNVAQLTRELKAEGFGGSYSAIKRFVVHHFPSAVVDAPAFSVPPRTPSPQCAAGWLLRDSQGLSCEQRAFIRVLSAARRGLREARRLARGFARVVRERLPDELDRWMARASYQSAPKELQRFAKGLRADYAAVRAALIYPWSNGQVEGQINRLKLIKRQMYGRAKLDLLRKRVLYRG
jgi:hypothetical protein